MTHAATYDGDVHPGREGLWSHAEVTPQREDQSRRATDASKLTFPLQLVLIIVGGVIATVGAFWIATSSLRSDMRDVKTMMSMQAEVDKVRQTLQDERAARNVADMNAIKAQMLTTNYDMQGLKTDVAIMKVQGLKK